MSKTITKVQLQAEVEALRVNAGLLETTVARLQAELADMTAKYEVAKSLLAKVVVAAAVVEVGAEREAAAVAVVEPAKVVRRSYATGVVRRIFEFDPAVKGDFKRAAALAKANCGLVARMKSC